MKAKYKETGEAPKAWGKFPNKKRKKDIDARWTKKNNEDHYGDKNQIPNKPQMHWCT